MKKCSNRCIPCCDFCIHAYHEYFEDEKEGYLNGFIRGGPIGCIIHYDEKHQRIAESCGWCDDFYCFKQYVKDVTQRRTLYMDNEMNNPCSCCDYHDLEKGDTLYVSSTWDGGIGFDHIENIRYCPVCGKELPESR